MIDTLSEVWGNIKRNKLRTIATGFAVSSGLFLVITLQGAGNGLIHTMDKSVEGMALDVTRVYPSYTSKSFDGLKEGRRVNLDTRDERLTLENFPEHVRTAAGVVTQNIPNLSYGKNSALNITLEGCSSQSEYVNQVTMQHGRFINDVDLKEKRKVIVLMERTVKSLFKYPEDAINQWVNANGVMYKVVGVFKDSEDYQTIAYAPFSTVQQIYNKGVSISRLNLITPGIKTVEDSKWFSSLLRRALSTAHRFDPKDESAVWIANYAETSGAMNQASVMIHSGLWVLGLLTLLSGITGVSNIMLVSVKERIHEFGIRRAIGAKPRNLIGMVIMESVIITAIFGYIGMVCGIAFTEYLDKFESNKVVEIGDEKMNYFIDPTVDISTCVEATLVIIAAGAIAGFIPAQKAAKVKPIEALREA